MKKALLLFFIICLLLVFFTPLLTTQAALVPCGHSGLPECTECHFFLMLQNIYNFLVFRAAPILGGLFIVIGGFSYIISLSAITGAGPSEKKVATGKKIITSVVIGLVIVYASWLFINAIFNFFVSENIPGFERDTWYQFHCVPSK